MGEFEDLNCDKMTIAEFRVQCEKWAAAGEIPADEVDYHVEIEVAWREVESGNCVRMTEEEFLKELETW